MNGKILKILGNDLYGNVDERQVVVFACFVHKKYMNKYVIFTFKDEYDKKLLYFGSLHLKEKSLVTFSVHQEVVKFVEDFVDMYLSSSLDMNEYDIMDISNIEKIELVSYNQMDCDKLDELDKLSIKRNVTNIENNEGNGRPIFLYIILIVLILLLGGVTYLYFNPDELLREYKELDCTANLYNDKLLMKYNSNREIKFTTDDKIKEINVIDSYMFDNEEEYYEFKDNDKQEEYFSGMGGYKYLDSEFKLNIIYSDKTIIQTYDEILTYLEKEGYSCIEGAYYE